MVNVIESTAFALPEGTVLFFHLIVLAVPSVCTALII
jgi:hypothetical protein